MERSGVRNLRDKRHELVPIEPLAQRQEIHQHLFQRPGTVTAIGLRRQRGNLAAQAWRSNARSPQQPQMPMAVSKAWPEADEEGGSSTVWVRERLRINACTANNDESLNAASAASRFSCRTMKSVTAAGSGGVGEKIFYARVIAPGQRRRILSRLGGDRSGRAGPSREMPARRAACTSIWAAPNLCSPARVRPCSSNAGPFRPAFSMNAGIHSPQVHGHQQTTGQQRQSENGAN